MAVQIANYEVVRKIENLAALLQTTKTAAVERALDAFQIENLAPQSLAQKSQVLAQASRIEKAEEFLRHLQSVSAEFDQAPRSKEAITKMEWDEFGLPV